MRDEEYRPQQLPSYGAVEQPAVVARAARPLRLTLVGTVVAAGATVATLVAAALYPSWYGSAGSVVGGGWWIVAASVGAVGLLACCLVQHLAWRRAVGVWTGRAAGTDLGRLSSASWTVHLLAYLAAVIMLAGGLVSLVDAGWAATSTLLLFAGLVAAAVALVLAGVQYVRSSGAPGTPPAHMHQLVERNRSRVAR